MTVMILANDFQRVQSIGPIYNAACACVGQATLPICLLLGLLDYHHTQRDLAQVYVLHKPLNFRPQKSVKVDESLIHVVLLVKKRVKPLR